MAFNNGSWGPQGGNWFKTQKTMGPTDIDSESNVGGMRAS